MSTQNLTVMFSLICLTFQVESLINEKIADAFLKRQPIVEERAEVSVIADRKNAYL
jgi:hypothetical protein